MVSKNIQTAKAIVKTEGQITYISIGLWWEIIVWVANAGIFDNGCEVI